MNANQHLAAVLRLLAARAEEVSSEADVAELGIRLAEVEKWWREVNGGAITDLDGCRERSLTLNIER